MQIYGSVLLNQRDSSQYLVDQFFIEPVTFPGQIADNPGFIYPVPVIQQAAPATQTVDYGRFVLGVKGDLPWQAPWFKNWTYDIFGQFSRSDGSYTQVYQKADRVSATGGSGIADGACDVNNSDFSPGSMAQLEPGVACVPINYFRAAATGQFTPAEYNFLYSNERGTHDLRPGLRGRHLHRRSLPAAGRPARRSGGLPHPARIDRRHAAGTISSDQQRLQLHDAPASPRARTTSTKSSAN